MKIEGSYRIEVERDDLSRHRAVSVPMKAENGDLVAAIDRFALTANNVTYAIHGADFGYWRAWPASDDRHGVVPVWGFATIVQGTHAHLRAGQRFWGFWPSASHARLQPERVSESGFHDVSGARSEMAPVYTRFAAATSPARPEEEDRLCLFQPLFATGFLIDAQLGAGPVAPQVVMTSASSKTALAAAWCLKQRGSVEVIGLTSTRHLGFAESTGCYHKVLAYPMLEQLSADVPAVLVDIAGDPHLAGLIHARMQGLVASLIVGDTHRAGAQSPANLPGPARTLFFAPGVWQDVAGAEGAQSLEARMDRARAAFLESTRAWLAIRRFEGATGWAEAFGQLLAGSASPAEGYIVIP
jgi:hypothetical protein